MYSRIKDEEFMKIRAEYWLKGDDCPQSIKDTILDTLLKHLIGKYRNEMHKRGVFDSLFMFKVITKKQWLELYKEHLPYYYERNFHNKYVVDRCPCKSGKQGVLEFTFSGEELGYKCDSCKEK